MKQADARQCRVATQQRRTTPKPMTSRIQSTFIGMKEFQAGKKTRPFMVVQVFCR
jgi:hypothetical protein